MNVRFRRLAAVVGLALAVPLAAPAQVGAIAPNTRTIGIVCTPPTVADTYNLVANTGYISTPDGNTVFMWSYANGDTPDNGAFQSPGPVLCVTQGHTITIHLHNTLPEPTSIVLPGQDTPVTATGGAAGLLTTEAPAGGDVTYTFTAANAGTYIYESGSDISKQVEMGLYGALIVRPAIGASFAYDGTTQFDPSREYMLLLAEIDPALHHAVETGGTYDFTTKLNRYFTINGRSFPDTIQENGSSLLPTQPYGALVRLQPYDAASNNLPALIRMLNVGTDNHPFHPHGNHNNLIAEDGRMLLSPSGASASTEHFGETVGSGQTQDFLMRWDDTDFWDPTTNPLPVSLPNYLNLDFKDGNTYYSGNPYLGYKGTLPTGAVSHNVCGEWYFPFHSHALNEFTNYDEGFGGMGTLLRVDPAGGCFAFPASTTLVGGVLKGGAYSALGLSDGSYYQVNPKTTTRTGTAAFTATTTTLPVASNAGFQASNGYYVRVDNEVLQVTAGAGTRTWTVLRGQLGTSAATHATNATITALQTDWYASFSGFPLGAANLKVSYTGKDCGSTTGTTCAALTTNLTQQTVKICNWTLPGGCNTATSGGWVTLAAPPAQPQAVGSTDVSSTWTIPGSANAYIGTGANRGQVRVLIHTQRWTPSAPAAFSTWANFMKLVFDAP